MANVNLEDNVWKDRAACKGLWDLFFADEHEGNYRKAAKVCWTCPVLNECKEDSLRVEVYPFYGYKAGMSPKVRQKYVTNYRRIARLKKHSNSMATYQQPASRQATA